MKTITTTAPSFTFPLSNGEEKTFQLTKLLAKGDNNTKMRKSAGRGFETVGLSMSPAKLAWRTDSWDGEHWHGELIDNPADHPGDNITAVNSCPMASKGCAGACLDHQGLGGVFASIRYARAARTIAFHLCREWFISQLSTELARAEKSAARKDLDLACRLDVFQDLKPHWLQTGLIDRHPRTQFYDYSKLPKFAGKMRSNYWVTFSRSETNHDTCLELLARGINVAVVLADSKRPFVGNRSKYQFSGVMVDECGHRIDAPPTRLPRTIDGYKVIDGDETDMRFLDTRGRKYGRWIALKLKAGSHAERVGAIASGFPIVI